MRRIKSLIIHCTDSDDSLDFGFRDINNWHAERGWLSPSGISCGYHYIVKRDGTLERGRPDQEVGAHVWGMNSQSLGMVWVGKNKPSAKQVETMLAVARGLMNQYNIPVDNVLGHYEFDHNKTCPNIDMLRFRGNLVFTKYEEIKSKIKGKIG